MQNEITQSIWALSSGTIAVLAREINDPAQSGDYDAIERLQSRFGLWAEVTIRRHCYQSWPAAWETFKAQNGARS